jgi:diacylglycerol O-acyltransferase
MGSLSDLGWLATGRLVSVAPAIGLPAGEVLDLPGRGRTYVIDTAAPPGAPDRPTLLLLHALACTGLLTWYPSIAALRERYRLVIFDQRWHGQGIRCPSFTLEDCADDAVAVADALGLETFVPVGYSMGSLVAQLVWRRHPRRVSGAVFGAATTSFASGDRDRRVLHAVSDRIARAAERRAVGREPIAPGEHPDHNRWAFGQFRATSAAEIAGAAAVISRFDSSAWIGGMDVPTSVVLTAKDRAVVPARQRTLARLLPDSTVYEVQAGHAACVMRSARFTPALLAACASVTVRIGARERR